MYIWLFVRCCRGNRKEECGTELWDCRDTSNTEITGPWPRWITATSGRENRGNNEPRGKENTLGMLQTNHYYENTVGVPQSNHYYVIGTILIHFWSLSLTRSFFSKHASRQTTWHITRSFLCVTRDLGKARAWRWNIKWSYAWFGKKSSCDTWNRVVLREACFEKNRRVIRFRAWVTGGRSSVFPSRVILPRSASRLAPYSCISKLSTLILEIINFRALIRNGF